MGSDRHSVAMEDDKVMMTVIAITVSWLAIAVIYFMAGTDSYERRF